MVTSREADEAVAELLGRVSGGSVAVTHDLRRRRADYEARAFRSASRWAW